MSAGADNGQSKMSGQQGHKRSARSLFKLTKLLKRETAAPRGTLEPETAVFGRRLEKARAHKMPSCIVLVGLSRAPEALRDLTKPSRRVALCKRTHFFLTATLLPYTLLTLSCAHPAAFSAQLLH